jgi:transposase
LLSLSADEAPLFVPVVTQPREDSATAAVADGLGDIAIEIGGVVVRAASGVDPAWLRDVLRAP